MSTKFQFGKMKILEMDDNEGFRKRWVYLMLQNDMCTYLEIYPGLSLTLDAKFNSNPVYSIFENAPLIT